MAIKKAHCAYQVIVKLNNQFVEKSIGDKYLKEETLLYLSEGHVYNDKNGEYVMVKGVSGINSGYAYLNELDLAFVVNSDLMKINAIVVMNNIGFNQILLTENFSDDNIKSTLSKKYHVDIEQLECLSTIGERMIYGVKEQYPNLKDIIGGVQPWYSEHPKKHFHYFHVVTACM